MDRIQHSHAREQGTGQLIVRITAGEHEPDNATLAAWAKRRGLRSWTNALTAIGDPPTEPLITAIDGARLLELEQQAARTAFAPLHSLTQYWRIDLRDRPRSEVARALAVLTELREVMAAWEEARVEPALVNPADDPFNPGQGYLDAAPTGIGARWLWTQPGGEGAGVAVVDLEGGWRTTHEDLVAKMPTPTTLYGHNHVAPAWANHGTAVLGVIAATDNAAGVVGIAPAVTSVRMSSVWATSTTQHTGNALAAAILAMSVGDILLIELQTAGTMRPVETQDHLLDLIRLATALGIFVVAAAGNGNVDLDAWLSLGGTHRLDRASPDFIDSGALMVGAAVSTVPHERAAFSNYGSRIDCYGWGMNVVTTGYGDLAGGSNADQHYTATFNGTSSASPIIVGAAALVQSRYQSVSGNRLSNVQLRKILSNPATGTPQGPTVPGAIGVMPDLAQVVPALGLVPDLYLRDDVGDVGLVPWTGALASSPDVFVRAAIEPFPELAFGQGSPGEDSQALGGVVTAGGPNYVYVRVRNRGGVAATNVVATVYYGDASTLLLPSMWQTVGTVTIPLVLPGDILTVAPPIDWSANIPAGHYCFVATIHHAGDPAPPVPGPLVSWSNYHAMIRSHNNVTWRNFDVIDALPKAPGVASTYTFDITGPDDDARTFGLEIERRLPRDTRLELEGPLSLLAQLRGEHGWEVRIERGKDLARMTMPSLPRIALGRVTLGHGRRMRCRFIITPQKGKLAWGHGVAMRQTHEGEEVGRVTWKLAPRPLRRDAE